jgi:hypothetical protein
MANTPPPLTWQQRVKLVQGSNPALAPAAVPLPPPYVATFVALQKATLGVYGTPADGWDAMYNPLVTAQTEHQAQLDTMNRQLVSIVFVPGAIKKTYFDPVDASMVPLFAKGDALLNEYALGVPPTPGGGSGPGSGGNGGGTAPGGAGGAGGQDPCSGFPTIGAAVARAMVTRPCDSNVVASVNKFTAIQKATAVKPVPRWKPRGK